MESSYNKLLNSITCVPFLLNMADNSHHCYDCNLNFKLSTMLLMHNLDIHRKKGTTRPKISSFLSNLPENESLYSSDSECEYRITTTVHRINKIKPEFKIQNDSDKDTTSSNEITRSSLVPIKRETCNDRIVIYSCQICGCVAETEEILKEHITNEHEQAVENDNDVKFSSELGNDDNHSSENHFGVKTKTPTKRLRSKKFSCDVCSKSFKQKAALVKHLKQHSLVEDEGEDSKNDFNDISDNYDTDDSELVNFKTKSTSGFPCNLCGKIYENKDLISNHFEAFHPHDKDALDVVLDVINKHEGAGFPCTSCPIVYQNRDSLHRHLRKTHQLSNKTNDNKTNQCWNCEVCGKIFYRPKCFATHLKKHSETTVEKRRTKVPKKKTHLCSFCGKSYPGSNHLKIHLRIHTGERPFKCQYCDKTFAIKKTWQDHTYSHTGEKPYFCPVENCGKRFTHSTGVRQHMQCCHSSEKQFQCPHCDKKCSKKTHLEDHIRSHTGERPYECKYCGIKFRLTSTLRIHHRTHTGERPFVCKVCNRGFIKSYGLKQHMKSKRNCHPSSVQPAITVEIQEVQHQQQQQSIDIDSNEDVQFHQLLILPQHQVLS